ncbi:MAG TPA: M20/M25/M40 family metallo-hydrolase [Vicinamibacterales bacterium]|nr:M20/M25/M40 family metallo-hydrolase [Vicinamibacterales bacterium]
MAPRNVPAAFVLLVVVTVSGSASPQSSDPAEHDPIATLVSRLDLERYKATIKGLTRFGDRRQGTDRNRAANDWIEAQLKRYGCTNTERLEYHYAPEPYQDPPLGMAGGMPRAIGGGRPRGVRVPLRVNVDPLAQPVRALRELNAQPSVPGPRDEVYCTKVGATRPDEMYIVGAHMDGHGWGEAANDNASGTALVMEAARIFSAPDVQTTRSIRFILWNNEESDYGGARAYIAQRRALQGREEPPGSGRYPEPKWLGMIQHDVLLFDHGMPRADGSISPEQRAEADVNIEFQSQSAFAAQSQELAWRFQASNEIYATDFPAAVGNHMASTDSTMFMDIVPSISLRESERGVQIGNGWDPHWHQASDVYASFSDKDFRLGLNAAQTTIGAIGRLAGATLVIDGQPAERKPRTR